MYIGHIICIFAAYDVYLGVVAIWVTHFVMDG